MTLDELVADLHALDARLREYEAKYGIASAEFHELYQQGQLDSEGLDQTLEFTRWASTYEMKLDREGAFQERSRRFLSSLRTNSPEGALHLTPHPELAKL